MPYENVETTDDVVETIETEAVEETVEVVAEETATEETVEETATATPVASVSSFADLKPKMKLAGKVSDVKLYGAFVDIGIDRPALLHISQIRQKRVRNVADYVQVGQDIEVWVVSANDENHRIEVTMVEPPALAWEEMRINDVVSGEVVRLENFGAFVNIGAERPGLIHVSELANEFVSSPEDVVKVGDTVEARIINVDARKKQVDLSLRAMEEPVVQQEEDDNEEMMTAMALALQQAMESSEKKTRKKDKQRKKKRRYEQDDIIERTLRHSR